MSRRTQRESSGLESDSFLDIVANIVGILIILIVVAGVRVSRAPLPEESSLVQPEIETSPKASLSEDLILADEDTPLLPEFAAEPPVPQVPPQPLPAIPVVTPPEKLMAEARRLENVLAESEESLAEETSRLERLTMQQATLHDALTTASHALEQDTEAVDTLTAKLAQMRAFLEQHEQRLAAAQEQLQEVHATPVNTKVLEHRLTPIVQSIDTEEVTFMLTGNRVIPVPLRELVELTRSDMQRNLAWIARKQAHRGIVGPIRGFELKFVASGSAVGATGFVTASLREGELVPSPDIQGETAEEALRPGSEFRHEARTVGPGNILRFFVYSDSFSLFHELRKFAHENGYRVTGVPIPVGEPIRFSPDAPTHKSQ